MSGSKLPTLDHAVQTTNEWLIEVARASGDEDRRHAYRLLRAWLHAVRDRLPIDVAAHLGAQLPTLLRGVYYEGWDPSGAPRKYDRAVFLARFAEDALLSEEEAVKAAPLVTEALARHTSPGQLDAVLHALPHDLRAVLAPRR